MIELTYDAEANEYCVYRGCDLIVHTPSYDKALRRFNELCDQLRGAQ